MSHFLWIEDFDNDLKATTEAVFGTILPDGFDIPDNRHELKCKLSPHGIQVALSFQEGWRFIHDPSRMDTIDYIVLDIDLPPYGEGEAADDNTLRYLSDWHGYEPSNDEVEDEEQRKKAGDLLKNVAGYHLYVELVMQLGFPRTHILICSNHGENLGTITETFKKAMMVAPIIYIKSDQKIGQEVRKFYDQPYTVLRRGIIESCNWVLEWLNDDDQLAINYFISEGNRDLSQDDVRIIWEGLRVLLPLREPVPEAKSALFRQFLRSLTHHWEVTDPWRKIRDKDKPLQFVNACILKNCRNWNNHGIMFEQPLPEALLSYLTLMNLRAMFVSDSSAESHEQMLFRLFDLTATLTSHFFTSDNETDLKNELKPLIDKHNYSLDIKKIDYDNLYFSKLLDECTRRQEIVEKHRIKLLNGIFFMYWAVSSNIPTMTNAFGDEFEKHFHPWCFPNRHL